MQPIYKTIPERKLIGHSVSMSLVNNQTKALWSKFSPQISQIANAASTLKYSLQVYPPHYFDEFNPANEFTKWALVEVTNFTHIPPGMETFIIPAGKYAVFTYRGPANDPSVFQYIYSQWLPNSGYQLDNRPHFEILGANYNNHTDDSEEEIWIPITV